MAFTQSKSPIASGFQQGKAKQPESVPTQILTECIYFYEKRNEMRPCWFPPSIDWILLGFTADKIESTYFG